MKRLRKLAFVLAFVALCAPLSAADRVRIAVLGLFHPKELVIEPAPAQSLVVNTDHRELVIEDGPVQRLTISCSRESIVVQGHGVRITTSHVRFTGRQGDADLILSVPGKIRRLYRGQLNVIADGAELVPVVEMDLETAVASVVAAELPGDTPLEALKAQAIVSRSYLLAGGPRHTHADFCDTTHCQFLRRPPPPGNAAARATSTTRGLVLVWQGKPFAAMYSASCGGSTHSLADIGYPTRDYPYFAVSCPYCRRSPEKWSSEVSSNDAAALRPQDERERIKTGRKLGWHTQPSNTFVVKGGDGTVTLSGVGRGHGVGLCQRGAAGMARDGKDFRAILAHYFPNTTIESIQR